MKEPNKMSEMSELPPALREAFGALGRDAPSAETVLRVQRALQALPAAAPAAAVVGTFGVGKLLVVATLIAGVVTSAIVLKVRLGAPRAAEPASAPIRASVVQEPASAQSPANEPALQPDPDLLAAEAQPRERELPAPARATPQPTPGTKQPRAALSARSVQRPVAPSTLSTAGSALAPMPAAEQAPSDRAAPIAAHEAEIPSAPLVPPASVAGAQASEAQRLAQCKRLAARDPAEALRQVEALARELPHGTFVQERELLAIRLHERLGHQATAAELTRRFRERYPSSVYRRALSP